MMLCVCICLYSCVYKCVYVFVCVIAGRTLVPLPGPMPLTRSNETALGNYVCDAALRSVPGGLADKDEGPVSICLINAGAIRTGIDVSDVYIYEFITIIIIIIIIIIDIIVYKESNNGCNRYMSDMGLQVLPNHARKHLMQVSLVRHTLRRGAAR